jgi:hypothetical protein
VLQHDDLLANASWGSFFVDWRQHGPGYTMRVSIESQLVGGFAKSDAATGDDWLNVLVVWTRDISLLVGSGSGTYAQGPACSGTVSKDHGRLPQMIFAWAEHSWLPRYIFIAVDIIKPSRLISLPCGPEPHTECNATPRHHWRRRTVRSSTSSISISISSSGRSPWDHHWPTAPMVLQPGTASQSQHTDWTLLLITGSVKIEA